MPNIFEYFDYHKYLLDYYNEKRAIDKYFSYRFMSHHLGIDAGYLVKVLQGKKNISIASVPKFANLFKLGKKEVKYLELLILFSKAKSNADVTSYFEKLLPLCETQQTKLETDKYEFYKKWYYSAIREIVGFYSFNGDFTKLAEMVMPAIKPLEAKKSIELLLRLELLAKKDDGSYVATSRFITTGDSWKSIAIRKYQNEAILLAANALETIPKGERDISTMTVSLSKERFEEVRERLRQFRQQIFEIAEKEQVVNTAYQLNLQFFPISKSVQGDVPS